MPRCKKVAEYVKTPFKAVEELYNTYNPDKGGFMKKKEREAVDFRELYRKQSWMQRADVLYCRAELFQALASIDCLTDYIKLRKKKHQSCKEQKEQLKKYLNWLQECENALQRAWELKADPRWHTYWMFPKECRCPKMDNLDRLGYGRIISEDCPLHGKYFGKF